MRVFCIGIQRFLAMAIVLTGMTCLFIAPFGLQRLLEFVFICWAACFYLVLDLAARAPEIDADHLGMLTNDPHQKSGFLKAESCDVSVSQRKGAGDCKLRLLASPEPNRLTVEK